MEPLKIILLEDNPLDVDLLESKLDAEEYRYKITCVRTRNEFVSSLKKNGHQIILSEYSLPNFDGLAALKLAQEICPNVPFLFVSGAIGEELAIASLKKGATDYILKDNLDRLVPAIQRALDEVKEKEGRKKAEKALRESENHLRTIIRSEPECVKIVSQNGLVLDMNPAGLRLIEANSIEQIKNKSVYNLIAPEYHDAFAALNKKVFNGEAGILEFEIWSFKGGRRWVESHACPLYDSLGKVTSHLAVTRDITERKTMEEALKRNRDELQLLINAMPAMLIYKDTENRILRVNHAVSDPLGVTPEDMADTPSSKWFPHQADQYYQDDLEVIRSGEPKRGIIEQINQGKGGMVWVKTDKIPIHSNTGTVIGIIVFAQDITEQKRAEGERKAFEHKLEMQRVLSMRSDRLRSLGEMAAGIAHELNQPLAGIRGLAEHLLIAMDRGWELTNEKIQDKLANIIGQADRMTHIIEHVRMFSRESGKPERSPVQVNDVMRSSMDILDAQFQNKGLELADELSDKLPDVFVNPFSLEEVILNLLTNARDAVEERLKKTSGIHLNRIIVRTPIGPKK